MKKRLLGILLCTVMCIGLLAGCGKKDDTQGKKEEKKTEEKQEAKKFKIGFAMKTQDSPYFVKLVEAVEQFCKDEGWECTTLNANLDAQKETENMETFVSDKVDMIFLDCVEPNACIPSINAANDAGIPVIAVDAGVSEDAKVLTTVYSDNKQNGRQVGLAYAKKMNGKPIKAVMMSGGKGDVAGYERRLGLFCGIIEGMSGCTEEEAWKQAQELEDQIIKEGKGANEKAKFTVAGQGWGKWTEEGGLAAAEDLITANKDLNCIMGENDQMMFGAIIALDNASMKGVDIMAAADGAQRAYDLIKEGKYFATGENSPVLVAKRSMEIAKEVLADGKKMGDFDAITMTEAVAVTKDNVDERYDYGF